LNRLSPDQGSREPWPPTRSDAPKVWHATEAKAATAPGSRLQRKRAQVLRSRGSAPGGGWGSAPTLLAALDGEPTFRHPTVPRSRGGYRSPLAYAGLTHTGDGSNP